jgi:hypothetical protein
MKKGKNRRYREARELKQADLKDSAIEDLLTKTLDGARDDTGDAAGDGTERTISGTEECVECRRHPHADWCMAEEA